jgi:glycosyltransferase involved in cell wall biosynthesis
MAKQTVSIDSEVDPISVTPFGVDTDRFHPEGEDRKTLVSSENESVTVIGTVKKLDEKYGIDVLIRAFARLRSKVHAEDRQKAQSLRLLIVGDGPLRKELEDLARECGVEKVTTFVGAVPHDEVPSYLRTLDVYVAPSRADSESFGVAILEASACECPVVVSKVGGLPEVVDDQETGIIVPPNDPVATSEAIRKLVDNTELRGSMGKLGRAHVKREYEWSACLDRMETVYQAVVRDEKDTLPVR